MKIRRLLVPIAMLPILIPLARAAGEDKAPAAGSDQPALVFLLAGQSQMAGHAKGDLPEAYAVQPANVLFFECGAFRTLGPRDYNSGSVLQKGDKGVGRFGPEISFGHEMAKAFPGRTIMLVKFAKGGGLAKGWHPDLREKNYDRLLESYRAATEGRTVQLAAMLWSQGSTDSRSEEMAKAYSGNLKLLIERLRKDLAAPELPFLYGDFGSPDSIPEDLLSKSPYYRYLVSAYVDVSKDVPGMHPVSRVGLTTLDGDVHYNTQGVMEYGRRFAKAFLELKASKRAEAQK